MKLNPNIQQKRSEQGHILLTTAVSLTALLGCLGLAIDVGRLLVAKNELQVYSDSAALAATLELDGTADGIARARVAVAANSNRWDFGLQPVTNSTVLFSKEATGPWEESPASASGYRYARVLASAPVPVAFMTMFTKPEAPVGGPPLALITSVGATKSVRSDSAAGQQLRTRFREGIFPFSPFAHDTSGPHFGLVPGNLYTLRWPSAPHKGHNVCSGDDEQSIIDLASAGGGEERGFIENASSDIIRASIEDDYQSVWRNVGDSVTMTGGAKQTHLDSLRNRIRQDSDPIARTYAEYTASAHGNGRRLVAAPVNTGYPYYTVVQIGAFFLLPESEYDAGGNSPFCAEYVGSWLQGSSNKAAEQAGAYVARLVQ
jgi:Flp pilus assembly protein TadG